ncbi:flagellar hook protein [Ectothiorhodospira haloalkaliphila]|uniref:Flagellar hook-associated protein 2 n=1 Tax=Ectothiorhodospira haloalkaliphila TaxID=421628 RepID=W8L6E0_9GAMM|nr:flagellar filament capping protein FliD [Ectothiorhodospira haloalkaliphila]AHK79445.1 flagellar hook protein [Ectothiorhodospira haloalkaliphila]
MATISSMGVGSGIDVRGLVEQLIEAERKPTENRIERREARLESEISGLGKLSSALDEFGSAVDNVKNTADFRQLEMRVGNEAMVDAVAGRDAPPGNYELNVERLAQAHRLVTGESVFGEGFSTQTSLGAGDVTIQLANGASETFSLEAGKDSLQDLRARINAESTQVRASVMEDGKNGPRLILTARQTGEQQAITEIRVDNTAPGAKLDELAFNGAGVAEEGSNGGFTVMRQAQDALLKVDGLDITRSSNDFNDVIEGVDMTLRDTGITRISVTEQQGTAREAIKGFVEAYNTLRGELNKLGAFNPETGETGALNGDATLRGVQSRLARNLGDTVQGMEGSVRALGDLGIVSRRDGTLSLDEGKLNEALNRDRDAVISLFTDREDGIAARMDAVVKEFTGRDSIINDRTRSLQDRMSGLDGQRARLDQRMDRLEARLVAQFSAMDTMVAKMNQTSEFLDNQLMVMNNNNKR